MAEQQQQHGVSSEDSDGVSSLAAELLSRSTELVALVDRLPALRFAVAGSTDAPAVDGCQEGAYSCVSSGLEQVCQLLECATQALRARLQPAVNEASQRQQLSPQQQSGCREADAAAADRDMAGKRGRQVSPRRSNRSNKLAPAKRCAMRKSSSSSCSNRRSGGSCRHAVVASSDCVVSDRGLPMQLQHDDCTTLRASSSGGGGGDGCREWRPLPASSSFSSARTVALAIGNSGDAEQEQQQEAQQCSVSTAVATLAASSDGCGDPEPSVTEHQLQLPPDAQASRVAIDGRGADDAVGTAKPHAHRSQQRQSRQLCNSPQSYPPKSGIGVECPTCGRNLRASALPIHMRLAHGTGVERRLHASLGGRGTAVRLMPTSRARAASRRAGRQAAGLELSADESLSALSADDAEASEEAEEEHGHGVEDDAEDGDDCELSLLNGDSARGPGSERRQLVYACALCVVVPPPPPSIEPPAQPDCTTPSDRHSLDGRPLQVVRSRTFVASRYDRLLQHVRSRHLTASGCTSADDGAASDGRIGTTVAASLTAGSSSSSGRRATHRRRRDLLACPECGRHLKLGGAVKDGYQRVLHHMWAKHGRPLPDYFEYVLCDRCDYRAYSSKLVKDHQAYSHGSDACGGGSAEDGSGRGRRAVCPECGKRVVRAYLKRHVQLMHASHQATGGTRAAGSEHLTCQQCGKCIAGAQNLARHVRRVHARQRDYLCHLCSQQFFERKELHAHLFARHGVNASSRAELACNEPGCAFRAIHREVLAKHLLAAHVTAREHPCGRCGKAFKTRAVLRQHKLLVHGRPQPLPPEVDPQLRARGDGSAAALAIGGCREAATVADTATATVVSVATAIAAESVEQRPQRHSCPHCSFSSHARQYLQRHIKIHSVEKRYCCDACHYKSHFLENVKKHKRNVHEKRAAAAVATHRCSDDALATAPMQLPTARSQIAPAAASLIPTGVLDALVLPASYECQQAMQQQTPRQCIDIADGRGVVSAQHVFNSSMAEVRAAGGFGQLQQPPIAVAQHAGLVGSASSLVLACGSDGTAAAPLLTGDLGSISGTGIRLPEVYGGAAAAVACDDESTCSPVALSCLSGGLIPQAVTLAELHQPLAGCGSAAADNAAAAMTVGMSTMLESIVPLSGLPTLVASRAVPSPVLVTGAAEPSSAEEGPMYPGTSLASIAQMPLLQMPFSPELHM